MPPTHKHPFIQTAGRGRPGQDPVSLLGPPHKHKAKGETRRDDNYLHGSRCLQVSLELGAPSAMKEKCRRLELGPSARHMVLMAVAPGCPFLPAVHSRRVAEGNQDIVMATRPLEEGTTWISDFSKGNLVLFPAQLLACLQGTALLEMPTMHKPPPPPTQQVAKKGLQGSSSSPRDWSLNSGQGGLR